MRYMKRLSHGVGIRDLRINQRAFYDLFNSMTAGFALHEIILDENDKPIDYRFLLVNKAFEDQTGLKADRVIGRTLYEIFPDTEPIWVERYGKVALTGKPVHFIHESKALERWYDVTAYCPQHGQFAVIFHDITERRRMEHQLAYRESFQRLILLMATRFVRLPPDRIDEATLKGLAEIGRFARADRAYQFVYDFEKQIMTNTHEWCADGIVVVKDQLQALPFELGAAMVEAHKEGRCYHVPDVRVLDPDDAVRKVLEPQGVKTMITIPMKIRDACYGFIGFDAVRNVRPWTEDEIQLLNVLAELLSNARERARDEEDRVQVERQLQHTQKLESLGLLAGGIAHDFNNILTTILGNADLALLEMSPVAPARANIEAIEKGAHRAADLCRQMLAYAGKGRFVIESFSLNDVIEEMSHLIRTTVSKRALVNIHLEPAIPHIRGDVSQIRQVILNLVMNASEAMGERSGTISISTGAATCSKAYLEETELGGELEEGLCVILEVTDTGHGMSAATQARIFDPFYTTKFTGRGLGLAAVLGIVRGHKGAMKVYSEPGRGSCFKVLWPAHEEKDATTCRAPENHNEDHWRGSGTVLLVDDEESIRALGRKMLERLGFNVITAADGREGLDVFREQHANLACVILDLTMPKMSGEEALREMKLIRPDACIVLASGYSKDELSDRFAVRGVAGFIQKPYSTETLRNVLCRVLSA